MQPRHILPRLEGTHILRLDGIQIQRRGIHQTRPRRTMLQHLPGDDGPRIQTHRALAQQTRRTQGDQVGGTGPGADEMNSHVLIL
ncbi:hypothetical protein M911_00270 [Ectothiorhodospira haloalkaliphila]|uniref:Uncharacterized protein n=1 Tax=Ectothiorhodospira haloalkaliphila TaxID=421628 RepID=W8KMY3_9GAMM|nr:hypothetical protein M911_00270 [Ectothiorhodospira haloalkaliphila]